MTVIQRSPNLGINIRLQRLVEVKVAAPLPAPPAPANPTAPVWWGLLDEDGKPVKETTANWDKTEYNPHYQPGLWVARVENVSEVSWVLEYVPTVWFNGYESDYVEVVAWTGDPIKFNFPPASLDDVFNPDFVDLPDPLTVGITDLTLAQYWLWQTGAMSLPIFAAVGNTLSVTPFNGSPGGVLTAEAFYLGKSLGSVKLTIKRVSSTFVDI